MTKGPVLGYYGGGDDMVEENEGTLDARATLTLSSRFPPQTRMTLPTRPTG